MKLRDMIRKKKSTSGSKPVPNIDDDEKYPYGLRITLEKEDIGKLGIDIAKFGINDKVSITAVAKIESIRQNKTQRGEDQCLDLQIIKMDVRKRTTLKNV